MIEYVNGTLVGIETQYVIVDCNGLGYQLFCPNPFTFQNQWNQPVKIHTYHYVREDLIRLYGFQSKAERALFEKLLNVSGIGPKGALAILAAGMPEHVVAAIENEDEAFLVKFPGVGKKTARQIILDLKGKLADVAPAFQATVGEVENHAADQSPVDNEPLEDAFEALRALGYMERELKKIRPLLLKENLQTDAYVKKALQLLLKV